MQVYEQRVGVPSLPKPIEAGVLCVAPSSVTPWQQGYYRAVTCQYSPADDHVLIKYVDYGGYANIPADDLRQIRCV